MSADFHDAAACLYRGAPCVAVEEERLSRRKHDQRLPERAIAWCLGELEVCDGELLAASVASKPMTVYERILAAAARSGPSSFAHLRQAVVTWSRSKLWLGARVQRCLGGLGFESVPIHFVEHHQSHAAAAFYPSPFDHAAVLVADGVGEWATTSIGHGRDGELRLLREIHYPDSLGLLYSALTAFCGFEANDGESKLMGLAPYGTPLYAERLRDHVVHLFDDGSFRLDRRWFAFDKDGMCAPAMAELFDGPAVAPGTLPGQRQADIAASLQVVLEEVLLALARAATAATGERHLCLAGGVALNCVANRALLESGVVDGLWIQPAAGDAGASLGAAAWTWHNDLGHPRPDPSDRDGMSGAFLGPAFDAAEIRAVLRAAGQPFRYHDDPRERNDVVARAIASGAVVGWFVGRMEFGPRALGHRSILADPRDSTAVRRINDRVKGREGFRPFAPAVLDSAASDWFDVSCELPYMLVTTKVLGATAIDPCDPAVRAQPFAELLSVERSGLPACTHVDGSARVQTVDAERNPEFHGLLEAIYAHTGCPVVLNTSFNRAGEPIVATPDQALTCAREASLDMLVMGKAVIDLSGRGDAP